MKWLVFPLFAFLCACDKVDVPTLERHDRLWPGFGEYPRTLGECEHLRLVVHLVAEARRQLGRSVLFARGLSQSQ